MCRSLAHVSRILELGEGVRKFPRPSDPRPRRVESAHKREARERRPECRVIAQEVRHELRRDRRAHDEDEARDSIRRELERAAPIRFGIAAGPVATAVVIDAFRAWALPSVRA